MPQVTNLGAILKQQAKLTSREIKDLSNMIYKHVLRIREERVDYFNEAGTPGSCPQPHHITSGAPVLLQEGWEAPCWWREGCCNQPHLGKKKLLLCTNTYTYTYYNKATFFKRMVVNQTESHLISVVCYLMSILLQENPHLGRRLSKGKRMLSWHHCPLKKRQ